MSRSRPNQPRVFCIGWHKTGTSSLGHALNALGYSVLGCRLDMVHPLRRGAMAEVLGLAGQFDALQDVPWAALFRELDDAYPGSRFILTRRNEDSWLTSASRHFGTTHIPLHEWLYGAGVLIGNERVYLDRFREHDREVREYFKDRPGDLLTMDLSKGDGWSRLCRFLGEQAPARPFPHSNKSQNSLTATETIRNRLRAAAPWWCRKALFFGRQAIRDLLGRPDPRNIFHNMRENRKERERWPGGRSE